MNTFTGISFIISHRETDDISAAINSIHTAKIKVPYEIISTTGNHPTYQRNHAAKEALYSHLYFLDDDSLVNPHSIKTLIPILKNNEWKGEKISLIGGPALLQQPALLFEESVDSVLSSRAVVGKIRARYSSVGQPRLSNDQEMILCNLVIEKSHFNQLEKFDTKLYPNEENDFIYRLLFAQKEKKKNKLGRVLYHPEIYISRPQRKTLKSYIQQMLNYGRGRAEQTKNNFKTLHFHLLLAIPFFLIFWGLLIYVFSLSLDTPLYSSELGSKVIKSIFFNFTIFYFCYTFLLLIKESAKKKKWLLYIPLLIFCCHFFYGMGLLFGFLKSGYHADKKTIFFKIKKVKIQIKRF